ncbi:MAG: L-2-amino-thiazoline-4-carboxylic acid hydrolase [Clostridia bacterium]|nr:L-2-amino-thiazoline-4-carboxylic acid hydrolase [Clostridia bacterium]
MSVIKNKPSITDDPMVNEVRNAIEHRATWMGLILDEARKKGCDYEAIGRAAVGMTGCFHGKGIFERKDGDDMEAFKKAFLTDLGQKLFEMDIKVCDDEKLEVEFHYCALVNGWLKQNFDQGTIELLCDIAMDGDRQIAQANNLEFKLGKTIAQGYDVCEVNFYKKK